MNIPRTDALKPRPRLGTPSRSQQPTVPIEGTTDADKLKTVPISTTLPTNGQVPMYDVITGQYVPSTVAAAVAATTEEAPVGVFSARELAYGSSYVRFHAPNDAENHGNLILGPGGLQRVEVLLTPRVAETQPYSPSVALSSPITTTTQTAITINTPSTIANGQYMTISNGECVLVVSGGGTTSLVIGRAQLHTPATTHSISATVRRVSVQAAVDINGGIRAPGGGVFSDLALQGYSTQELLIRACYTNVVPLIADGQTEFGYMKLSTAEHSHAVDVNYKVEIDTTGAPGYATFRWSDDGGATWIASLVPVLTDLTHLQNGVTISFTHGSYFVGNAWTFTAIGIPNQNEELRVDTVNSEISSNADIWHFGGNVEINQTLLVTGTVTLDADVVVGAPGNIMTVGGTLFVGGPLRMAADAVIENEGLTDILKFPNASALRILVPALVGADASPAATYAFHVEGDQCITSQLVVGATSAAVAGIALQLVGGRLRMAATTNDYIEDSAGNRHLTFASSATAAAVTSSFAGGLRVNGTLGVGAAVPTTSRVSIGVFPNLGAGSHNLIGVQLSGTQSANATAKRGFGFSAQWDINGNTLGSFVGILSTPGIDDIAGGGALTNYAAFQGGFSSQGLTVVITDSAAFWALAPVNASGTVTTHRGVYIENQGEIGFVNSYAIDIAAQSGANTFSGTIRALGVAPSIHEPDIQLFASALDLGGGVGVLGIKNAGTNPTTNPTGGGILYSNGGALEWRGSAGTVTVIAPA